jgi:hypothetical protein
MKPKDRKMAEPAERSTAECEREKIAAAHLPAVLEGLAQAKRKEFATTEEIEAAFRRFDR